MADQLEWIPARVPGTAAGALRLAGIPQIDATRDLDDEDWWFRTWFDAGRGEPGEQVLLRFGGIATVSEIYLNGERILESSSMFESHSADVTDALRDRNELVICCRALNPLLASRRKPRARWRTRVVKSGGLRFYRTMLIGRAPGFAPGPAAVGPWGGIRLERRRGLAPAEVRLRTRLEGADGVLSVRLGLRRLSADPPTSVRVALTGPSGDFTGSLNLQGGGDELVAYGELRVPGVATWQTHTHGEPVLHRVRVLAEGAEPEVLVSRAVGFRALTSGPGLGHEPLRDGLDLHLNGVRVFARGAVWTPVDPVGLAPEPEELRDALTTLCDAGMNMVRLAGIGMYESDAFYDLCDELGILVWQDFMFANMDYPLTDRAFRTQVEREARAVLDRLAGRASLAVLCGNSEIEQQVGMLGLDPAVARGEFFGDFLPAAAREAEASAVYLPSAPCGEGLPFRTDSGVANYFGVGAYLRPIEDARRASVPFASECLAFANVPDESEVGRLASEPGGSVAVFGPDWKEGVPRDVGAEWDFDDVRDHYLELLFGVDPAQLRVADPDRYLELSRAVSGEVMAETFGEWRRERSPCGGGIVLWHRDLVPGAGWGLCDSRGEPKVAYHHLRRALAPVAVWMTDEGLGGYAIHVANDRPHPLSGRLRVRLFQDLERCVGEAEEDVNLPPHSGCERDLERMLGHFADVSWAYRFGPPAQDAVVLTLESAGGDPARPLSQTARFPAGRPSSTESEARLGLEASASISGAEVLLRVRSRRLAYGVRVHLPGYRADEDAFTIEPGAERLVTLKAPANDPAATGSLEITALNMSGRARVPID